MIFYARRVCVYIYINMYMCVIMHMFVLQSVPKALSIARPTGIATKLMNPNPTIEASAGLWQGRSLGGWKHQLRKPEASSY